MGIWYICGIEVSHFFKPYRKWRRALKLSDLYMVMIVFWFVLPQFIRLTWVKGMMVPYFILYITANVVYRELKATEVCLGWFKFLSGQFQLNSSPAIKIFRLSFHREVPWTLNPVLAIFKANISKGWHYSSAWRPEFLCFIACCNPCAILVVYIYMYMYIVIRCVS